MAEIMRMIIDFKTGWVVKEVTLYLINRDMWLYRERGRRNERPLFLYTDINY